MRFALIHSPLVGPATWRGVAEVLVSLGHDVDVPDLRAAAQSGDPRRFLWEAQHAISPDTGVVAGHSGAGFFLPSIATAREAQLVSLVFVDAGLPPCEGTSTASADFLEQLRSMSVDGVLPRWSSWWGAGVMERLVPDQQRRLEVEAELPEVHLAFYETPIKQPDGWCSMTGGFVLLSEGYRRDAALAKSLGWPVVELLGDHLDLVNNPGAVAGALTRMTPSTR